MYTSAFSGWRPSLYLKYFYFWMPLYSHLSWPHLSLVLLPLLPPHSPPLLPSPVFPFPFDSLIVSISFLLSVQFVLVVSVQFSSVAQSCSTLCDPMNCSTPGLPVHHQLPEVTQTHVHWVSDAIQPSHPLSSPSPPAPNPSQHQSLFQWVNSSHEVAKVLEFQL